MDNKRKDLVCGMEMTIEDVTAKSEHKGKTYYFCHHNCKAKFDKNPKKYITTLASEKTENYDLLVFNL